MLETPHVALGAAIAVKIPNPLISIPLALGSHFLLEMVPHWNPHLNTETKKFGKPTKKSTLFTTIDASLALIMGTYIAFDKSDNIYQTMVILACCFFSVVPDLLEAPYFFLGMRHKFFKKWIYLQKSIQADVPFFWGMLSQTIVLVATLVWIFI